MARPGLYALGAFGSSLLQQTVLLWLFYFYAPPPGQPLPPRAEAAAVGVALGIGRVVDALADPLVAHWSDRVRSRWGRRRPFILAASPLLALTFVLVWRPPHAWPSPANALYLAVTLGLFFFLYTLVLNPYTALLPDLTPGGRGRLGTVAWLTAANLGGVGMAFVLSPLLADRLGFPQMGLVLAPLGLAALLAAGLGVHEPPTTDPPRTFRDALRGVWRDGRFRVYLPGLATLWFGLNTITLALALVVTVLMGLPRAMVAAVLGAGLAATVAALPLVSGLAARWGAPRTLRRAIAAVALLLLLLAGVGRWPLPLAPALPGTALVVLAGPAVAGLFMLPNALLATIAEEHGRAGRGRVEGMFFAFQGIVLNGVTAASAVALGALLNGLGYTPPLAPGLRAALLLAAASCAVAFLIFSRYPNR